MTPKFDEQGAFFEVKRTLLKYLGWRKRRNFSLAVDKILQPLIGKQDSFKAAERLTGVPPIPWLTIAEAEAELTRRGVHIGRRKLYRLAEKAALAGDIGLSVRMDADGNWDSVDSSALPNAETIVVAQMSRGVTRFQVCSLSQFQGNRDTQHASLQ